MVAPSELNVMVRYSDFEPEVVYDIIIHNLDNGRVYRGRFLQLWAAFTNAPLKPFWVIFPKYMFKRSYLAMPLSMRKAAGKKNVRLRFYRTQENKKLVILSITKYVPD